MFKEGTKVKLRTINLPAMEGAIGVITKCNLVGNQLIVEMKSEDKTKPNEIVTITYKDFFEFLDDSPKSCTCTLDQLMIRGCQCGGK